MQMDNAWKTGRSAEVAPREGGGDRAAESSPFSLPIGVRQFYGLSGGAPAQPAAPSGGGDRLPSPVQAKMEHAFGADFSQVRVHEGSHVSAAGALAYTENQNLHFAPGQYDTGSTRGQELLGHELTHVVQQSRGRVGVTRQFKGMAINDDPGLEGEADRLGAQAARGERVEVPHGSGGGGPVVQGMFILDPKDTGTALGGDLGEGQPLKLADDGTMAVPHGNKAKKFYATQARVDEANQVLQGLAIKSPKSPPEYSLATSGAVKLKDLDDNVHDAQQVVGVRNHSPTDRGNKLTSPERCNEAAQKVVGNAQTTIASPSLVTRPGAENMGLDLATYATQYASDGDPSHAALAVNERRKAIKEAPQKDIMGQGTLFKITPSSAVAKALKSESTALDEAIQGAISEKIFKQKFFGLDQKGRYQLIALDRDKAEKLVEEWKTKKLVKKYTTGKKDKEDVMMGKDTSVIDGLDQKAAKEFAAIKPKDKDKMEKELRLDAYAEPEIGQAYGIFPTAEKPNTDGFPYHWAGVVAKSGADTVTLENYFRGKNEEDSLKNYFQMYGPVTNAKVAGSKITRAATTDDERKSGSFHESWKGAFADTAVTSAFGMPTTAPVEHPGLPGKQITDENKNKLELLAAYWRQALESGCDDKRAKRGYEEISDCATVLEKMFTDRPDSASKIVEVRNNLRLASENKFKPPTKPSSWGLEKLLNPSEESDNNNEEKKTSGSELRQSDLESKFQEWLSKFKSTEDKAMKIAAAKGAIDLVQANYNTWNKLIQREYSKWAAGDFRTMVDYWCTNQDIR